MTRFVKFLGSLTIAVPLLIVIAAVLAWGTIYETRFGTAAVQRTVYTAWWFQALLGFLAINLAVAALERYPWKRQHTPFVMAHIGIILILVGGIIGGRFGLEGQLIIPEGQAERVLQLPHNVLVVHQHNPGITHSLPTTFDSRAWVHEPNATFRVPIEQGMLQLTVDRYFPDAQWQEHITADGTEAFPAIRLMVAHEGQEEDLWLLARDPERFGVRWGEAHVLFLEPATDEQLGQLLGRAAVTSARGVLQLAFPDQKRPYEVRVPDQFAQPVPIAGTPYTITFKDYFPDFAITEQGLTTRSDQPNNPAVSFLLNGPQGQDPHLVFALHPEFPALHAREHTIPVQVTYQHSAAGSLPPNAIALLRDPTGKLSVIFTGSNQEQRHEETLQLNTPYTHPWLEYQFRVTAFYPKAKLTSQVANRSNEVHAEAVQVTARLGDHAEQVWLGLRQDMELRLGEASLTLGYRPAQRELPVSIKLSDFRKIEYPGTQMAAGFESDVQLTDSKRGLVLMRTISMNNPLKYRGFSFFQSSFVDGPTQTTILSVRNDPGTPLVYAGFIIVIAGVITMFVSRRDPQAVINPARGQSARRRAHPKHTRSI